MACPKTGRRVVRSGSSSSSSSNLKLQPNQKRGTPPQAPVPVLGKSTEIFQNFGTFLAHHRTVTTQPQFTTNPPHSHHKNTTPKTKIFKNPLKNPSKKAQ